MQLIQLCVMLGYLYLTMKCSKLQKKTTGGVAELLEKSNENNESDGANECLREGD